MFDFLNLSSSNLIKILSVAMKDLKKLANYYFSKKSNDLPHPLHRNDPLYKATDAHEQAEIIQQKQQASQSSSTKQNKKSKANK